MTKSHTITALNQAEAESKFRRSFPGVTFVLAYMSQGVHATLCRTDDHPVQGARKWVTKHYIYQYDYKESRADDTIRYMGLKKVGEEDSKTDALKEARRLTLESQQRHTIRLVKVLDNGDNIVTDMEPKTSRMNTYNFAVTE